MALLNRRHFMMLSGLGVPMLARAGPGRLAALPRALARLEQRCGGRLGVAILDSGSGEQATHRGHERFAMCSTFKFLLAAAVLRRIDRGELTLGRMLRVPEAPLLGHSPLTQAHAGAQMSVAALCAAVTIQSDNTAANLLLDTLGGPAAITAFARSIGDAVTRLDRTEPALNEARAGDPRDTTSPIAMLQDLQALLLGPLLSVGARERLTGWMIACETGLDRLRATLPPTWRAADKTGTNGVHTSNDIGVFWPPRASPVLITAYLTHCPGPEPRRAALLAQVGQLVIDAYSR